MLLWRAADESSVSRAYDNADRHTDDRAEKERETEIELDVFLLVGHWLLCTKIIQFFFN